jgi:hypothetical protein
MKDVMVGTAVAAVVVAPLSLAVGSTAPAVVALVMVGAASLARLGEVGLAWHRRRRTTGAPL